MGVVLCRGPLCRWEVEGGPIEGADCYFGGGGGSFFLTGYCSVKLK